MDYVIIGNGIAGVTAAFEIRRNEPNARITIISDETDYFFSRTALMYIAMKQMSLEDTEPWPRHIYSSQRFELVRGKVLRIDTHARRVFLHNTTELGYDKLLLATGSEPAHYNWPGQELEGVVSFVSYNHLQDILRNIELVYQARRAAGRKAPDAPRVVVVGGGLIGIELVEVFLHYGFRVDFLVRDGHIWHSNLSAKEGQFVAELVRQLGVTLHLNTALKSITGREGRVSGVITDDDKLLPCELVALATGVVPCIALAAEAGIDCARGILTDWQLKTSARNVFAAGDCTEIRSPGQAENYLKPIWYTAREMGLVAGNNMVGRGSQYVPALWYNSAKFFSREYTAVGQVQPVLTGMKEFEYQDKRNSVRIVYDSKQVYGFSLIGGRWDHEVLQQFILKKYTLYTVLESCREALFVSEFSKPTCLKIDSF